MACLGRPAFQWWLRQSWSVGCKMQPLPFSKSPLQWLDARPFTSTYLSLERRKRLTRSPTCKPATRKLGKKYYPGTLWKSSKESWCSQVFQRSRWLWPTKHFWERFANFKPCWRTQNKWLCREIWCKWDSCPCHVILCIKSKVWENGGTKQQILRHQREDHFSCKC